MATPTERSLKYLRALKLKVWRTEHWNGFAGRRIDLFGFIDIVALNELGSVTIGVQTTSAKNVAARITKIKKSPYFIPLLECGWEIHVHGWKKGKRGDPRIVKVT